MIYSRTGHPTFRLVCCFPLEDLCGKSASSTSATPNGLDVKGGPDATADAAVEENGIGDTSQPRACGKRWTQVRAMDVGRAELVLSLAARLHASFWQDPSAEVTASRALSASNETEQQRPNQDARDSAVEMPQASPASSPPMCNGPGRDMSSNKSAELYGSRDSGGCRYAEGLHKQGTFTSLEKRDPGDLPGLEEEYAKLLSRFREVLPAEWFAGRQAEDDTSQCADSGRGEVSTFLGEGGLSFDLV